jgi:hypothetical protein
MTTELSWWPIAKVRLGDFAIRNRLKAAYFALAFVPPRPNTEAASLAVATTAPVATLATVRIGPDLAAAGRVAGLACLALLAATLWIAPGVTFFGAALPKLGFASFVVAGPVPGWACVVLDWLALLFLATGFLLLVAI